VSIYGLTAVDPFDLEMLVAVGATRDVHLHVLHPSPGLWSQIAGVAPIRYRSADPTATIPRHPLLRSWGRESREMQLVLAHHGLTTDGGAVDEPLPATLLHRLQADIRANRPPAATSADRSIQIHACHGARRQVEVLRDALLHILGADPTLEPRDIVIMTPDLATFAPLLEAGFPQGDSGLPDLRVRIADRSPAATNPLVRFAVGVLDLADGRLDASAVRELVTRPLVQQRFGFDGDTAAAITRIIGDATIAWGLDAAHRAPWGVAGVAERTWSRGLDRALAGVFYSDSPVRVAGDVAPLDGIEGQDARPAGLLAAIVDRIASIRERLAAPLPMSEWAGVLADATRMLADPGWEDDWQWNQLERLLAETFPPAEPVVSLAQARRAMAAWTDDRPSPLHFRTGDVTVCTLVPMRSVPYRVVCLLGMDHDRFPRSARSDGDDLLADGGEVGDHDRSSEDRQLLLDALMAAGDHLVVTYSGRDEVTSARYPPAVPIAELVDVLAAMTGDAAAVETSHPLQSFSEAVFTEGALGVDGPWGFDPIQLAGARAVQRRDQLSLDLPREWSGGEPPDVVRLDDLVRFLANPVRGFVRASLGFTIPAVAEQPDDSLPAGLDGLASWALKDRLIDGLALGHDIDDLLRRERAADRLPPGALAASEVERARVEVEELWQAALERGYHLPRHRWFVGEVEVGGRLVEGSVVADPQEAHLPLVTPSRIKAAHRLRAVVECAFLTALESGRAWHALLLTRRKKGLGFQETVVGPLGDTADDRRSVAFELLDGLVRLFDDGHRTPLALPCETGFEWARSRRQGPPREVVDVFEHPERGEHLDLALQLVFPALTSFDELRRAGFDHNAERLWGPILPLIEERRT
jgi:exodeoxyribonuclease V gamma subunit